MKKWPNQNFLIKDVQNYWYVIEYALFRPIGPIPGSVFKFELMFFPSSQFQVQASVGLQAPLRLFTPSSLPVGATILQANGLQGISKKKRDQGNQSTKT